MTLENGDKVKLEYIQRDIEQLKISYKILNDHSGVVNSNVREIKTDVAWLKRFFWIVATAAIGSLVTAIIQLTKLI